MEDCFICCKHEDQSKSKQVKPFLLTYLYTCVLTNTMIATLTIHLHLPACSSLKEKRGRIKPLIARLHREFNISVAETDLQDKWQEAVIVCAMVGNDHAHLESALQTVARWVERKLAGWRCDRNQG